MTGRPRCSEDEEELHAILASWRLHISMWGDTTLSEAPSPQAYFRTCGIVAAYETALEVVERYGPRTKNGHRSAIVAELRAAKAEAVEDVRKAKEQECERDVWEATARCETLRAILAEWLAR